MRAQSAVDIQIDQKLPWRGSFRRPFRSISHSSDAPLLLKSQQLMSRHEQIRQRGDDEQAIAVLHHAYPEKLVDQKETLQLGGEEIQVLFFHGGHTPGDAVVWLPKSRTLFSGDQIYVDRLLSIPPISNSKDWLASFEAIEKLKPKTIIPGHGKVCDLQKAQQQTGNYLKLLRSHMRKAIDAGSDLQTAINTLDQSAYKHMDIYEQLKGGNASRVYLEMETE